MEYAKDEIYTIKYRKSEDKPKIQERNRFILLLITLGLVFSAINFVLIYNFFSILSKL